MRARQNWALDVSAVQLHVRIKLITFGMENMTGDLLANYSCDLQLLEPQLA